MTTDHLTLGTQFNGMTQLRGTPSADLLGRPLHRYLSNRGEVTWQALATMTPAATMKFDDTR